MPRSLELPETTHDFIFDRLSPATLLRLRRVSRYYYRSVNTYIFRTFRIENTLKAFFKPAELALFRQLQERTGALISGSTALRFFDRRVGDYEDVNATSRTDPSMSESPTVDGSVKEASSDLDLYVEHHFAKPLGSFLEAIGYRFRHRHSQRRILKYALDDASRQIFSNPDEITPATSGPYWGLWIGGVFDFERSSGSGSGSGKVKIQLIMAKNSPLEGILNFHSTCVMNVIAHDYAYALYPWETFEERKFMSLMGGELRDIARAKYVRRGWQAIPDPMAYFKLKPDCDFRPSLRFLGDNKTWKVKLHPDLGLPASCIEANSFELVYMSSGTDSEEGPGPHPTFLFNRMNTKSLKFSYLMATERIARYVLPALSTSDNKSSQGTTHADATLARSVQMIRDIGGLQLDDED